MSHDCSGDWSTYLSRCVTGFIMSDEGQLPETLQHVWLLLNRHRSFISSVRTLFSLHFYLVWSSTCLYQFLGMCVFFYLCSHHCHKLSVFSLHSWNVGCGFKRFHSGTRFQMFAVSGVPACRCHVKKRRWNHNKNVSFDAKTCAM